MEKQLRRLLRIFLWWYLRLSSLWVLALGRILYQLEIHGGELLPTTGPFIIVSRHSSRIEVFRYAFLSSIVKEWHGPAAGPDLANSRILAWLSRELGMLPARSLSVETLMKVYQLLREGKIIMIMADGEVPWDGRPLPLRPGASWLALRSHAPVVVSALHGAYDIWPRWASRPRLSGKLVLRIGRPFYLADGPCQRVTAEMIAEANRRLIAELEALSAVPTVQTASVFQEQM
jgi:1-acyl-sn-glycerol-3-phosphate acyltransferase